MDSLTGDNENIEYCIWNVVEFYYEEFIWKKPRWKVFIGLLHYPVLWIKPPRFIYIVFWVQQSIET